MATAHLDLRITERFESSELPLGSSPDILPFGSRCKVQHTHTHTHKHPQNEERETSQRSLSYSLQLEVGSRELRMGELLPSIYDGIVDLSLWNRGENLEDILTSHVPLH